MLGLFSPVIDGHSSVAERNSPAVSPAHESEKTVATPPAAVLFTSARKHKFAARDK
jgi:hypothetical protein